MRKNVARYDVAIKAEEGSKCTVAELIKEVASEQKITLHSNVKDDPSGKGVVVTCIQGTNQPFYQVNNAVLILANKLKAKLQVQTAVIQKSNCYLEEASIDEISYYLERTGTSFLLKAEEDNLFDNDMLDVLGKEA